MSGSNPHRTGRGSVKMRAKVEIEEKGQTQSIIVTRLPYRSRLVLSLARLPSWSTAVNSGAFATSTTNRPVTTPVS